jgi:preprotein translocase subunit SecE
MSRDKTSDENSAPSEQVANPASPRDRIRRYVEDVRLEMRQVSWPTWDQVQATTLVVLFFTFAMSAFVFLVDTIAKFLYRLIVGR